MEHESLAFTDAGRDAHGPRHSVTASGLTPPSRKGGLWSTSKATPVAFLLAVVLGLPILSSDWTAAMLSGLAPFRAPALSSRPLFALARSAATPPAPEVQSSGGSWQAVASPTTASLLSVSMVSANEGWAVGGGGTILHYSNGSWQIAPSPTSRILRSVAMVSASEGWAVGDFGTIVHYAAGTWQAVASPTTNGLLSVYMVSANDGWAVGGGGVILRYTGGSWQTVASPTGSELRSVAMVSPGEGWAVGDFRTAFTSYATILRYAGGLWQTVAPPTLYPPLVSVAIVSPDDGWAVGLGILRYACGSWQGQAVPGPRVNPRRSGREKRFRSTARATG